MRRLAWSTAACTTLFSLYAIFFSSPSVSDSATVLSSDEMEKVRGAGCQTCVFKTYGGGSCETQDCWHDPPFSYKRAARSFYKCGSGSAQKKCETDNNRQMCAFGARFWSEVCHSWSWAGYKRWHYPEGCVTFDTSC